MGDGDDRGWAITIIVLEGGAANAQAIKRPPSMRAPSRAAGLKPRAERAKPGGLELAPRVLVTLKSFVLCDTIIVYGRYRHCC